MSPTITDLLALHDLDLGALAHKVGVTGENFTTAHAEALYGAIESEDERDDHATHVMCNQPGSWGASARVVAALGAKVRVALSQLTIAAEPPPTKTRPQPGDVVSWEVEDGSLYAKEWGGCRFVMVARGERSVASGPEDGDIETFLLRHDVLHPAGNNEMTLVARDLGTDPEAWRKAMREWTANGNKPAALAEPSATASPKVPSDEAQRIAELEAEVARLSQTMGAKPTVLLGSVRDPRTVAIALLNLAEQHGRQQGRGSRRLFCWLVQESRAWAALER